MIEVKYPAQRNHLTFLMSGKNMTQMAEDTGIHRVRLHHLKSGRNLMTVEEAIKLAPVLNQENLFSSELINERAAHGKASPMPSSEDFIAIQQKVKVKMAIRRDQKALGDLERMRKFKERMSRPLDLSWVDKALGV